MTVADSSDTVGANLGLVDRSREVHHADQQTRTENGGALNQRRSRQALLHQEEADETVETLRTGKRRKNHVATESPAVLLHGPYCGLTRNGGADRRSDTCQAHHQRYADVSQYQCCCFHNELSF